MYIIKRTTFTPSSSRNGIDYFMVRDLFSGFQHANIMDKSTAETVWRKFVTDHHEYYNQRILEVAQYSDSPYSTKETRERDITKYENLRKSKNFEILLLSEMPERL